MQHKLDRLKMEFYHFDDKKMYNVLSLHTPIKGEGFARVYIDRPFINNLDPLEVNQMTTEERSAKGIIMNWKSGIDGMLRLSTGLKDKNGKLVFEGDILKVPKEYNFENIQKVVITWQGGCFGFQSVGFSEFRTDTEIELFEVIGNIYENKELN